MPDDDYGKRGAWETGMQTMARTCWMMKRVFPAPADSTGVSIESIGNNVEILALDARQIKNVFER